MAMFKDAEKDSKKKPEPASQISSKAGQNYTVLGPGKDENDSEMN